MAVIEGGNVITGGVIMETTGPRILRGTGAPSASTYAGRITAGDLYVDVANNQVYEFTSPGDEPTFSRIDTV